MTVQALTCSERLWERVMGLSQRGVVHSAFASAANLGFAHGGLLSLNASSEVHLSDSQDFPCLPTLMPNGLLLSARKGCFPFTVLKPGMPVTLGAGWLTFETLPWALDCSHCALWNPHITPWQTPDLILLKKQENIIAELCLRVRPWSSQMLPALPLNLELVKLAEQLCGRGAGLTPAGDDFLAGLMALGWLLSGPQPAFLASCQCVLEIAREHTHALSQCWLAYAAAGDVAQPIGAFLEALTHRDNAELEARTIQVLSMGASSGYDLLQGVLYGIRCFLQ